MKLRNLIGYLQLDCEVDLIFHMYSICYYMKYFVKEGGYVEDYFRNEPYFDLAHFGCFIGNTQMIIQDVPNHQY